MNRVLPFLYGWSQDITLTVPFKVYAPAKHLKMFASAIITSFTPSYLNEVIVLIIVLDQLSFCLDALQGVVGVHQQLGEP